MANAKKCDRCGEFYILASEKIPDSNETFAYSNVIQDSVLEISYYPDKPKEKYDLCKKCTNMLINFLKEKKENTIYAVSYTHLHYYYTKKRRSQRRCAFR